jgi:CheY-like chemotaxis protein
VAVPNAQLPGARVLVVDDDDDSLYLYEQALGFCGATVVTARTARGALAAAGEADIVVTDLLLPGKDGIWLLDQVNALPRPIPVIVVTGVREQDSRRLPTAAFARKLLKPVDPMDVATHIADVLRGLR